MRYGNTDSIPTNPIHQPSRSEPACAQEKMEARSGEAHVTTEIKVPDIGDFKEVPVIEILVKEGDAVNTDDPMISLESDKATMEVPAPAGGIVEKLLIKVGDKVSEGTPILLLKGGDGGMKQPP